MSHANGHGVGPSISRSEREQARKEAEERQRRQQDEQAARSVAQGAATQQGTAAPGYWDMLGDPDLDHPEWGDSMEAFTKAELSRAMALGNITRSDWKDMQLRIENEFWQIQNEMRDQDTKLQDDDERLLYGEQRPTLDDAKARRLRAARDVKKNLTSLSIGRAALRSGTEIHAVAKTENVDSEDEESEVLGGLGSYLGR